MLGESETITERSQWKKIKGLFSSDPRYKAVDSSKREEYFNEHMKALGYKVSHLSSLSLSSPPLYNWSVCECVYV